MHGLNWYLTLLDAGLEAQWRLVRDQLGPSLSKADVVATVRYHRAVLAIAGGLLGFVLLLLLVAAWALHCLFAAPQYVRAASEMSSLLEDEDEAPTSL